MRQKPTGLYARRIWFLYEWLLGRELKLPAADKVSYVDAVDTDIQFADARQNSARHRVRNNHPGTPEFYPLVFRTSALNEFIAQDWKERARRGQPRAEGSACPHRRVPPAEELNVQLCHPRRTAAAGIKPM
ncbi:MULTISPECIES: hypothetical protein [unclassified Bradyrhizobium]|uniref:hypothetical protein n=1 Tax=unclassified Bradyrhizobium TaxID=2631580 RepID=UPI00247967B9|nr:MULTISPECIES: hypothetical protein [unclassified Bradyrhizobium]WGR73048.1 hypothetical protein MTX24_09510 [Bradyrhizobium sp. ISRA426]WGR77885.1 hypothetical protein MTX21_34475 [Bradyrhizobium sp. ISRA430]WGR88288.1 hypothetical protein MTX25_09515 [Bradyrhizobium sp. ISRA432]